MAIELSEDQKEAIMKMKNGCILCGGTGSGKSRTALAYYFKLCGGQCKPFKKIFKKVPLYIITTAKKRDTLEWEGELVPFMLDKELITVDSWNNIKKYKDIRDSFFIFDEQRVVGSGVWVKSFLKISRYNQWILLSATPGDSWMDYVPVFIANGFYRNKTEFIHEHVVYSRYSKFPKVDRYINDKKLARFRDSILVDINFDRKTVQHHIDILCDYNKFSYKQLMKERWNVEKQMPIENASELCSELRKIVNKDISRVYELHKILHEKNRIIVFYNFDYELEILKNEDWGVEIAEWNGHKHQDIPNSSKWMYLVQYNAGSEGWNCILTDTIVFYSLNYSYRATVQASGRIDRRNTPYTDLYYYHFKSKASIDIAISRALSNKKKFNESKFVKF